MRMFRFAVIITITGMLFLIGCALFFGHSSDKSLKRRFNNHRNEFSTIIRMAQEDGFVIRIAPTFTRLFNNWAWPRPDSELGFSTERWDEYKRLFKILHLDDGISHEIDETHDVYLLISSSSGIVNRGSSKGYAYSERLLTPQYDSLDSPSNEIINNQKHGIAYKHLEGPWYIFYGW